MTFTKNLIGREQELANLNSLANLKQVTSLKQLTKRPLASLVVLKGRTGIGKSQLAYTFANSLKAQGYQSHTLAGRQPESVSTANDEREDFAAQLGEARGVAHVQHVRKLHHQVVQVGGVVSARKGVVLGVGGGVSSELLQVILHEPAYPFGSRLAAARRPVVGTARLKPRRVPRSLVLRLQGGQRCAVGGVAPRHTVHGLFDQHAIVEDASGKA